MNEQAVLNILMDKDQLESIIYQAQIEAYERFKQDVGLEKPYWNSKNEIRKEFKWSDETLTKLMNDGLPYIQVGEKGFHFHKQSVNNFLHNYNY